MNITLNLSWLKSLLTPYPARDWAIVVSIAGIVLVLGFGLAAYTFWGIQTGSLIEAVGDTPVQPVPVSHEVLDKVINAYSDRITNYQAKNFPAYIVNDPHKNLQIK